MRQLALAILVSAVTAAVYGPVALLWWRRARVRSRTLRLVAAVELEPYHAALLRNEATEAAAAELVLAGHLRIDDEGAAFLTEQGRDPARAPAHPLPAALLEAVRRHDPEPVSIGWIDWCGDDYHQRLGAYRSERKTLLPRLPRMPGGERNPFLACCGCVGIALVMLFWLLASALLVTGRPQGLREWACAVVAGLGLSALLLAEKAGRVVRERTECGDPLGDLVRSEPHPAFAALDEEQRTLVLGSIGDRHTWRGVDTVVHEESEEEDDEDDEWLDDKVWWEDAYEYRASDEDEAASERRPGDTP
ncbi:MULTISPECIES: hypothetical protein [unclassified Streptomyces]|uniref:hypothetical protein n=1 Tax=unclassified Streptomyces TaxID=2593676 RepID=UPI0006AF8F00|nr:MULTISPECIES: hypothetical protein [unclassified Streptomyces]KOU94519.1 hypothetical protein ADK93_04790 [Streptomyces sp. XY58]KOV10862.1 hypothetical protein ADK89_04770 [Streptomyces sp. XY37]KOV54170.1 hypothetical protein ADK99_05150 [Streptomyces sp. MMG1064]